MCSAELLGTITVNPDDALALTSAVGTEIQALCDSESLDTIVYEFSEGATRAHVSGLPARVNACSLQESLTYQEHHQQLPVRYQVYPYTVTTFGCL